MSLFGLVGKKSLFGKKPEEYITLENLTTSNRVYIRVHGVYSATYLVDAIFPLSVGTDTIEVEVAGPNKLIPEKGVLQLPTKLRKTYRNEGIVVYDQRAEEVNVELREVGNLVRLQDLPVGLAAPDLQRLLDTVTELARQVLQFRIKAPVTVGNFEKEAMDLSDTKIVLLPYYVLTYLNSKTGERKTMTLDASSGTLS